MIVNFPADMVHEVELSALRTHFWERRPLAIIRMDILHEERRFHKMLDIFFFESSSLKMPQCTRDHIFHTCTGCSLNIVFFSEFWKIFWTLFSLGGSVCTHTRQVEHQRCGRTGRVQKNHKGKNTIFNEHPVCVFFTYF